MQTGLYRPRIGHVSGLAKPAQKEEQIARGCCGLLVLLFNLGFWGLIIWVAWHFISKYW